MTPAIPYLNLVPNAASQMLDHWLADHRAWTADRVNPADCMVELDGDALIEITQLCEQMVAEMLPITLIRPEERYLRAVGKLYRTVRHKLDSAHGIAIVTGIALDGSSTEQARALAWVLGHFIGQPVAQKWDGTMLYDVRDTGLAYGYGTRGSYTNVELVFHNDNAFGVAPPEYVGLMCLRPAKEGGESRFCSIYSVHNQLLKRFPRALQRLYRPLIWDRQAEHAPSAPTIALAPMFSFDGESLHTRANTSLVRKGYALAGHPLDAETEDALAALDEVVGDSTLWFGLALQRGHLQYLNNRTVAHYRSAFIDTTEPEQKRHLVSTWYRNIGDQTYDGHLGVCGADS